MSFLEDNQFYVNPPSPYDGPDFDSRVPGWGPMARAAGPERWGVGVVEQKKMSAAMRSIKPMVKTVSSGGGAPGSSAAPGAGVPWWVWVAVPMVVGGAALFAFDMGWLGD